MTQVGGAKKKLGVPVVPLVALALCWPLVLGGPSYPLHLCGLGSDAGASPLLGLYAGELMVCCALVAARWDVLCRMPMRPALGLAAVMGSLAALALLTVDPRAGYFSAVAFGAMGVLALATVVLFSLWTAALHRADPRRALGWTALSFVLFALAELLETVSSLRVAPPTVIAPVALIVCAALVRDPGARVSRRGGGLSSHAPSSCSPTPRPASLHGAGAGGLLVAAGCACLALGLAGDVLYAVGSTAVSPEDGLWTRRVALRCVEVAVFAPVAVALVRGRRPLGVLACAFAAIVALLVAELQSAPILLQVGSASADLPGVMIMATSQAFLWLAMGYGAQAGAFGGPRQGDAGSLAPVYLGAFVALPKAATVALGSTGLLPGSPSSFAFAAVASSVVVALACLAAVLFLGRLTATGRLPAAALAGVQAKAAKDVKPAKAVKAAEPAVRDGSCQGGPWEEPPEPGASSLGAVYGLSRREEEVFGLVSRGYTARRIAETLCVSESTAQTHIRRIYAKVGVHSKQELIEVLERAATPE